MTTKEAAALKPGDRVLFTNMCSTHWPGTVSEIRPHHQSGHWITINYVTSRGAFRSTVKRHLRVELITDPR